MILGRQLTAHERRRSQNLYCAFNFVNGMSYMCLGESLLVLFAAQLGAPNAVVALLGAMQYIGYAMLPLGVRRTSRRGAAASQADFWIARNVAALITASAGPDWLFSPPAAWALLLLGAPVSTMGWRGGHKVFVLDATIPAVQKHIEDIFRDIRSLGIDYVKLDFCMLECSAPDAVYFDRTATRAQALRRGMEAIRRGFGDDGFILGGTMVFAPAVGIADAMRVSTDITPYWDRPGQHAEAPNVANVCRNIVHHAYMNGRLWVNDPDTLIVRDDHTELTQSEVELWERAVSLAGGSLLLSDRMATLTPERLALVRRALAEAGDWKNLHPADCWERTLPTVWEAENDGRSARAAFDFGGTHDVLVGLCHP